MIRVLIADDHHLVRAGIRALLEKTGDIGVVGETDNGLDAVEGVRTLRPDVAVLDIGMPTLNGHEATARIRALGTGCEVIILSMHAQKLIVHQALARGARGYVLKSSLGDELPLAIRAAARGETYLSPAIASAVIDEYMTSRTQAADPSPLDALTPRERHLLQLIAEGCTNREAAQIMSLGERTVEADRASLMSKLDAHDVAFLVRIAIKYGLVSLDE